MDELRSRPLTAPTIPGLGLFAGPATTTRARPRTALKTRWDHSTTPRGSHSGLSTRIPLCWGQSDKLPVAATRYQTKYTLDGERVCNESLISQLNQQVRSEMIRMTDLEADISRKELAAAEDSDEDQIERRPVTEAATTEMSALLGHIKLAVELGKSVKEVSTGVVEVKKKPVLDFDFEEELAKAAIAPKKKEKTYTVRARLKQRLEAVKGNEMERNRLQEVVHTEERRSKMEQRAKSDRKFEMQNVQNSGMSTKVNRMAKIQREARIREARRKMVLERNEQTNHWALQSKIKMVDARREAHENAVDSRRSIIQRSIIEARVTVLHPLCVQYSRVALWSRVLVHARATKRERRIRTMAIGVIIRCLRKYLRKRRLQRIKRGLPKLMALLRKWCLQFLMVRRTGAAKTLVVFLENTRQIGDIPAAVKRYLHRIRVIQRCWRAIHARCHTILEIWDGAYQRYESAMQAQQVTKGLAVTDRSTAVAVKRHMEIRHKAFRRVLRLRFRELEANRQRHMGEMELWFRAKADFDQLESARLAILAGPSSRVAPKKFRDPPLRPYLPISLSKTDLKKLHKDIEARELKMKRDEARALRQALLSEAMADPSK